MRLAAIQLHMTELQQPAKIFLPAHDLATSFAASLPVPLNCQQYWQSLRELDTPALVLSCSYSDPHVVHHRLVLTYNTKLY